MRINFILFFSLTTFSAYNQSLTPTVIGSSGDFFSGTNASLSWTLGEIMTETYFGTSNQLTQGFHQPTRVDASLESSDNHYTISIYPNPARDNITINIEGLESNASIALYDISGQIISSYTNLGNGPMQIDLSQLADGIYLMEIKNENKEILEITKIQKTK